MRLRAKPSARIKRRYLLISGAKRDGIEKAILDYIGSLGWARASGIFVKADRERVVLAVSRDEVDNVRAAFELSGLGIKILRVSGTLKGLGLNK